MDQQKQLEQSPKYRQDSIDFRRPDKIEKKKTSGILGLFMATPKEEEEEEEAANTKTGGGGGAADGGNGRCPVPSPPFPADR
jgi:hypothetical protein